MYGYIYLTTNVTNGMKYIGKHKSEEFDPDYFGSGKILLQSLYKIDDNGRRYKDSSKFTRVILHWCKDKDELNKYEEFFIDKYNAVESPEFYNLTKGGTGDSVAGVIYVTNGVINKKIYPEELPEYEALGFHRGGPKQTRETIEKRAASNRGKKRTQETRNNISNALKGRVVNDIARQTMSNAKVGKSTSRKGKICVSKNGKIKYIQPVELEQYLLDGYTKSGVKHKNPEESSKNYSKARKGQKMVNDGTRYYYIRPEQLEEYLAKGYTLGKPKKN